MTTVSILPDDDDGDWTEVVDGNVPRVDLVGKAANGSPRFLILKSDQSGLLDPETVRALVKEATPDPVPLLTPAALMAAIHSASAPKENPMTQTAAVVKADDAKDAADAVVGDDAPLPDADDTAAGAKDGADGGGTPTDAPGDPDDPSSPAWEAVDAARARQALQLTIALQRLVAQSADREAQEVATGSDGDMDDVWTLEDVGCAIDAIISMLAPFAITEQAEADQGTADAMTKSDLAALIKSGRVLSSANEAKISGAVDALQSVLATLPAPTPDDAAPVAKEKLMPEPVIKTAAERSTDAHALLLKATTEEGWRIEKAKGDPQMAVFDADGKLVGTIDPTDLSPIAAPTPPDGGDATPAAQDADAPPTADAPSADTTPAPPATVGTPANTPATPPAPPIDDDTVTKSTEDDIDARVATLVKAALEENQSVLKGMQDEIAYLRAPAVSKVATNGAIPPAHLMRGQDGGALLSANDAIVADLRKSMASSDPAIQNDAAKRLNEIAAASLTSMLQGGPQ